MNKVEQWTTYIERYKHFIAANDIADAKKISVLLSVIGCKTYGLLHSLIALDKPGGKSYTTITAVLQQHFSPKPLVIVEHFRFHKRNHEEGETVAQYVAVLKRLSEHYEFGEYLKDALWDRFVCGLKSVAMQKQLLTEVALMFEKAVEVAVSVSAT